MANTIIESTLDATAFLRDVLGLVVDACGDYFEVRRIVCDSDLDYWVFYNADDFMAFARERRAIADRKQAPLRTDRRPCPGELLSEQRGLEPLRRKSNDFVSGAKSVVKYDVQIGLCSAFLGWPYLRYL